MRAKCLAQENNTLRPVKARTRTARSAGVRTNHKTNTNNDLLFFRDILRWKFNLNDRQHYVTKSSWPLPQRDRVCLAHKMPRRSGLTPAHAKHIIAADQGLFRSPDHARECQSFLKDYLLRMRVFRQSGDFYFEKQRSLHQVYFEKQQPNGGGL